MSCRLLILGAGGHGRAVAEAAAASGTFEVIGFLDDAYPAVTAVRNMPVLGAIADCCGLAHAADQIFVVIDNSLVGAGIARELTNVGLSLATVMHPRAIVSQRAIIGPGSAVMTGAAVGAEACQGLGVIVNRAAVRSLWPGG